MNTRFYDWSKTLSYDAPITMVIGARGIGKTYGIRKQAIKDFFKDGSRFVEVCRFREEMKIMERNYFDRVGNEFPEYVFKIERDCGYIAKQCENPKNQNWELLCYFVAMSSFQIMKKATFNNVRRIIMDECVIERSDKFHRYLPDEWNILTNIVSSVSRERPDSDTHVRLYLLGNACNIINPYFEHIKVTGTPERGYSWHDNKTVLLHYPDDISYVQGMDKTLAGLMMQGTKTNDIAINNTFVNPELFLIEDKTPNSKCLCTFLYRDKELAIWVDERNGMYYFNDKTPKYSTATYALTLDEEPNYPVLKKRIQLLQVIADAYRMRICRFSTPAIHGLTRDIVAFVGG